MIARAPAVMVVEDDPLIAELLHEMLGRGDYAVTVCRDGDAALNRMLVAPPDLVVLDVMMPRASGFDVLRAMRESGWGETIPVLMITAGTRLDRMVEAVRCGASDYLMKPFTADALLSAVERLLTGDGLASDSTTVAVRATHAA